MSNKRQHFIWWVFHKCGIQEGQILPRWARGLVFLLMPGKIILYLAAKVYDIQRDCFVIDGVTFSHEFFHAFRKETPPGQWFRVIKQNGVCTVEKRTLWDESEASSCLSVTYNHQEQGSRA